MPLPDIAPIKKGGEAATSPLNPEPSPLNQMKAKQKANLCRCAFMLISGLFLPAIPANQECKTKQKGPTIYMIDPFLVNQQLPILPGRFQPSTFGVCELNYRVRHGYGCILTAIATESLRVSVLSKLYRRKVF